MRWPLSQDYNEAIQSLRTSFADSELQRGTAVVNALGIPLPCSGNFADVYQIKCPATRRNWAVKCFTRQIPGLRERYQQVSLYLRQLKLPFMVGFTFLDQGIRVRGDWYPVLKMEWIQGFTLNQFVRNSLDQPQVLEKLCQIWLKLAVGLRQANIAHCDLQHGNVLLVPGRRAGTLSVKLVDYDGMCVPALVPYKSIELGHPSYQHPQRLREGIYSLEVDRFSHLVIYTALRGLLVGGRPLWDRYDNGDNLLFCQQDFQAPARSSLFRELDQLDPEVRRLAQTLSQAAQDPMDWVALLEEHGPVEVQPLAERLMAKRSEDRNETPAELGAAIAPFCTDSGAVPVAAAINVAPARFEDFGPRGKQAGEGPPPRDVWATCPACGRAIPLQSHELSLTIECARCNTRFVPARLPAPPEVRVPLLEESAAVEVQPVAVGDALWSELPRPVRSPSTVQESPARWTAGRLEPAAPVERENWPGPHESLAALGVADAQEAAPANGPEAINARKGYWPLLAALGATALFGVVLVLCLWLTPVTPTPTDPNPPPTTPDALAAEWVLSIGGTIKIKENGKERQIGAVGDLPQGAFALTFVHLAGNQKVSDAGLAQAHFKNCKNLTGLDLLNTEVSDAGLAHFKDCKNLTWLCLIGTDASAAGVAELRKALPKCNIEGT